MNYVPTTARISDGESSRVNVNIVTGRADLHAALSRFNRCRLTPGLGAPSGEMSNADERRMQIEEMNFVESVRRRIQGYLAAVPEQPEAFVTWFEKLRDIGPGQGDRLFPWLADNASLDQMRWFLEQEVAGEAGFDDLVAMTQVKMPVQAKLEMARNYWDEMGRGERKGMHGPMLEQIASYLQIEATIETTVPESLALGNMMVALAFNRRYAFHSVGALGVIEMTAPDRARCVVTGLDRLGVPKKHSHYYSLHAILDIKHSDSWNAEVLAPLVAEDPRRARPIAEGALLRLWCGAQCYEQYRAVLGVS